MIKQQGNSNFGRSTAHEQAQKGNCNLFPTLAKKGEAHQNKTGRNGPTFVLFCFSSSIPSSFPSYPPFLASYAMQFISAMRAELRRGLRRGGRGARKKSPRMKRKRDPFLLQEFSSTFLQLSSRPSFVQMTQKDQEDRTCQREDTTAPADIV